jgi:LacI family transcriptional regulator
MHSPTLRTLARSLGLSRTTISEALRGSPRVKAETIERVRTAAAAAGYRHNPLAGAVMSELRRSRTSLFRGVLAVVDLDEPDRPVNSVRFYRELIRGATERAAELGFKVTHFVVGQRGVPLHRLDTILQSRGIQGVILLPVWRDLNSAKLDWARYAGVYTEYVVDQPALHSVCSDHYRSMLTVLQRLYALGYQRPGLFVERHSDERLQYRWSAAFLAYHEHHPKLKPAPVLICDKINRPEFSAWFRRYRPDVVIGHLTEVVPWMRACGARIPKTHGFFCLNLHLPHPPCAGLDLQPRLIGAHSVELVITQLYQNKRGAPETLSFTFLPSRWIDGPTLRSAPPKERASK